MQNQQNLLAATKSEFYRLYKLVILTIPKKAIFDLLLTNTNIISDPGAY